MCVALGPEQCGVDVGTSKECESCDDGEDDGYDHQRAHARCLDERFGHGWMSDE